MRLIKFSKYSGYYFTMNGEIYNENGPLKNLVRNDNNFPKVVINDMEFDAPTLLIEQFIGVLNYPVYVRDGDWSNLSSQNLAYRIPECDILAFDNPFNNFILAGGSIFRQIKKYRGYFVSPYGVIYSVHRQRFLVQSYDKDGYRFIKLSDGKQKHPVRVAKLVIELYGPEFVDQAIVEHYDGNKSNNAISNLSYASIADNNWKRLRKDVNISPFTDDYADEICKLMMNHYSLEEISDALSISQISRQLFYRYCQELYFGNINAAIRDKYIIPYLKIQKDSKILYSEKTIRNICELLENKVPKIQIARNLNIPVETVKNVWGRFSWKYISKDYKF